ncbi:MFS transporter [Williamsia soli]|uniref:MFS transporter n=1 Tax=Williamsia soli TaxID=364929 RepID=UPI001A9E8A0C|nr:MFS transporter [Williamsia soli]
MDGNNSHPISGSKRTLAVDERALAEAEKAQERGRGRWILAIVVLVVLTEQTALGFQLIAPALTDIAVKYDTTQVIWVITAFTLVGGVVTPIIGKLGDRFGKRRVLIYAALISIVGAAISALAPSFEILLAGRALTGVSTAFLPITYALMRDVFPAGMRDMSISIATNGVGVVTIAGPFIAGFLIDNVSMESVFWFVAVLSAIGAIGTIALVPESPVRDASKIDFVGAAGVAIAGFMLLLGISQISTWDFIDPRTLSLLIGGLVVLALWWMWEKRHAEPFISPEILKNRSTATVLFAYAFAGGAITVIASYLPTLLQTPRELAVDYGFGVDATGVARYLLVPGIMTVLGGIVVGFAAKKYGFRVFLIIGAFLIALGSVGLATFTTQWWGPVIGYGIVGFGAMVYAAGPNLLMQVAPAEQRGVSAGMLGALAGVLGSLFAQLGGLILSKNTLQVVAGLPIYSGKGVTMFFLLAAAVAVVGGVIAFLVPRRAEPLAEEPEELIAAIEGK